MLSSSSLPGRQPRPCQYAPSATSQGTPKHHGVGEKRHTWIEPWTWKDPEWHLNVERNSICMNICNIQQSYQKWIKMNKNEMCSRPWTKPMVFSLDWFHGTVPAASAGRSWLCHWQHSTFKLLLAARLNHGSHRMTGEWKSEWKSMFQEVGRITPTTSKNSMKIHFRQSLSDCLKHRWMTWCFICFSCVHYILVGLSQHWSSTTIFQAQCHLFEHLRATAFDLRVCRPRCFGKPFVPAPVGHTRTVIPFFWEWSRNKGISCDLFSATIGIQ